MSSLWRQSLESWLKTIEVSGSVLDVGGAQKSVRGRTKTWDVDKYLIGDISEENGAKKFDLSEERDWEHSAVFNTYQNVFCLETVMYCVDPVRAVENLVWLTEKNLYISNPLEAYGETKPEGTDMHRLFPNWWKYWLTELGMEIKEMQVMAPKYAVSSDLFNNASKSEGYKMIRPHASGVLIWVQKNG